MTERNYNKTRTKFSTSRKSIGSEKPRILLLLWIWIVHREWKQEWEYEKYQFSLPNQRFFISGFPPPILFRFQIKWKTQKIYEKLWDMWFHYHQCAKMWMSVKHGLNSSKITTRDPVWMDYQKFKTYYKKKGSEGIKFFRADRSDGSRTCMSMGHYFCPVCFVNESPAWIMSILVLGPWSLVLSTSLFFLPPPPGATSEAHPTDAH